MPPNYNNTGSITQVILWFLQNLMVWILEQTIIYRERLTDPGINGPYTLSPDLDDE